ncbi:baeRF11 domain-containing protein [Aeromicrobium sp.]|uniref:baeRF11 domain-containing protein n=1 Tax=Aeromicrobium sp. TaxID=1871063 RepID=UPI002FCA57C8
MSHQVPMPTRETIEELAKVREPGCVSIYLPALEPGGDVGELRLRIRAAWTDAAAQLIADGLDDGTVAAVGARIDALVGSRDIWQEATGGMAIFVRPSSAVTFHLNDRPTPLTAAADRFVITPLLAAATSYVPAFLLALSDNAVRLLDLTAADAPRPIEVPGMPDDLKSAVALDLTGDRNTLAHLKISEDHKTRVAEFARRVDGAVRPIVEDHARPLVLAAAEPVASIFRATSKCTRLEGATIVGNPEDRPVRELQEAAQRVLRARHVADVVETLEEARERGRVVTSLDDVAASAAAGAVDTLVVDPDKRMPGSFDESTGDVHVDRSGSSHGRDIVDDVVRQALRTGTTIEVLRDVGMPGGGAVAAILRYVPAAVGERR